MNNPGLLGGDGGVKRNRGGVKDWVTDGWSVKGG